MKSIDRASLAKEIDQLKVDIAVLRRRRIAAEAAAAGRKRRLQRSDIFKLVQTTITPDK